MGIHGIYKEIGPGRRIALSKLAVEKFEETQRPLRIAIDVSIWLFQIQASKGGTNPALRTFYYRLLRLIALSIHPVFVFDGPDKPPFKRGKRTGPNVASVPEFLAKQLLKQFGFPIHLAPGEAEAECALLQREGIVDAVLSEDVDTLMFGSGVTIRNWSPELKTGKTPTHVNVYDALETKNGSSGLDREGMILVALMSGGDYVPEGIPGCGPKTACEAARAGFGHDLCAIRKGDAGALKKWRERLQHELKTNESKLFKRKHTTLAIPEDFPRADILGYYTHPVISSRPGLERLKKSIKWDQDLDFPGLREFAHDAFDWVKLEGAKHFIRSLAPSLLVRKLRMRAEGDEFVSDDLVARQEHEATLVKGIHGKRQHPTTDNTIEVRISFKPIDLVTINLDNEDPDDDTESAQQGGERADSPDLDEEVALDMDDGETGPRKRGPTKFDPCKPARVWVPETFVQMGVPLAFEDWRAGVRPKPAPARQKKAVAKGSSTAPATRTSKRTKPTAQSSINSFAKVTKPGARNNRSAIKASEASQHSDAEARMTQPSMCTVVSLLDSSPVNPRKAIESQHDRQKSLSPILELPSSVTKRRRRGNPQRTHALVNERDAREERPSTPSRLGTVETLDLFTSPAAPSPSELPSKRPKTRASRNPPTTQSTREDSMVRTPTRTRQTTLDAWSRSATKTRKLTPPRETSPSPNVRNPRSSEGHVDTLDLTLSSPAQPSRNIRSCNSDRRSEDGLKPRRPPLQSINSNASFSSASSRNSDSTSANGPAKHRSRRPSPSLAATAIVETVDLTDLCSSPVPSVNLQASTCSTRQPSQDRTLRRSPRNKSPSIPLPDHKPSETVVHSAPPLQPPPESTEQPASAARPAQKNKKRYIELRESLPGFWKYVDLSDEDEAQVPKGKERKRWRESQVEVLDIT